MKFQPDTLDGVNSISRHDPGRIVVGPTAWTHSLLVPWVGRGQAWDVASLRGRLTGHFERLVALQPEW
jgi:hypothetical protein